MKHIFLTKIKVHLNAEVDGICYIGDIFSSIEFCLVVPIP